MARKNRADRGLHQLPDTQGKLWWHVRLYHEGKDRWFGSFPTKTKAREFYEKAKTEQKEGRFFPEKYQHGGYDTVEDVIDRYLVTAKTKKAYYDEQFFGRWWKAWFKGERLNAITPQRIEDAKQHLAEKEISSSRINRYQAWLRHMLNVAIRDGKLTTNPTAKVRMSREPKGKTRYLSIGEETKLVEQLGQKYGPYARFAILTGLRQKEQFHMEWSNVDLEKGFLTLPTTKAGETQYIPLNEEAKGILRSLDSWQRSKWVFPSENPASPIDPCNFMKIYRDAVHDSEIEWVTWHDLRHTFASRLAMQSVPLATIAALLRHSTTSLVKRYAHLSPDYLKDAVEMVSVFGKDESKPEGVMEEKARFLAGTVTGTATKEQDEVRKDA